MKARTQAGLSIVEVMVGLMVGILVTLSAWGSVMFYEANRRSGVGGNSALENAMATASAIQRDVKAAGLGFVFAGIPACGRINVFHDGVATADGSAIAPVTIVDGGAAPTKYRSPIRAPFWAAPQYRPSRRCPVPGTWSASTARARFRRATWCSSRARSAASRARSRR